MQRVTVIALLVVTSAVVSGCAATPSTGALATPWGVGGIHSFKPQALPAEPSASKVDKQVAQLLDDASQSSGDADVRVAAKPGSPQSPGG